MKSNNHTGGQLEHHLQDGNVKCDGLTIANCNSMFISHLVSKANADRIVKCWNNHDRLLEALQEVRKWYEENHQKYFKEKTPIIFSEILSTIQLATK